MPANTYDFVRGNKEDVSNIVTMITPKDTPFYTGCGRTKATATLHEWLEDALRAAADNRIIEGEEFAVESATPRVRLDNVTQISRVGYGVTGTQEVVLKHGVKSEMGYQMAKAAKELALDIERALITQATKNPGSKTAARIMGGVPFWITTNSTNVGGALTEDELNSILQACWQKGGRPSKVYLSGNQKRVVSSWTGKGDAYVDSNKQKLINMISSYQSDFGVVSFIPHRMMEDASVFVIDPDYWKVAYLRPIRSYDLPKTGDSIKKVLLGEYTLEARAEAASGMMTGLTA